MQEYMKKEVMLSSLIYVSRTQEYYKSEEWLSVRGLCLEREHERNFCIPGNVLFHDLYVRYTV